MNAPVTVKETIAPSGPTGREAWIDVAKGMAIILVVLGHVGGGLLEQNLLQPAAWWQAGYEWVYLFHMPVFFFLSGWLARKRHPLPPRQSLGRYAATLLYPYFVWGLLTWFFHLGGDAIGATNYPTSKWVPVQMLYDAQAGPWFLYVLFIIHVLWLVGERDRRTSLALLVVAFLVQGFALTRGEPTLSTVGRVAVYYGLGFELAGFLAGKAGKSSRLASLLGGLCCFGLMTALFAAQLSHYTLRVLLPACLGVTGTLFLACGAAGMRWTGFLEWAGRNSLIIYVTHAFAPPFVRWFLVSRMHIHQGGGLLAAGFAAAFLSSGLVIWLKHKYSLDWLFRWPTARRKPVGAPYAALSSAQ
jgi:fucose 4-O-acetylase-like acetyltransferase